MSGQLRPMIIWCRSCAQLFTVGCPLCCLCRFRCHGSPIKTLCHLRSGLRWWLLSNICCLRIPYPYRTGNRIVAIIASVDSTQVTGCCPALGGGLPSPGLGSISSSSMNRLVTGCVPAPSVACHAPWLAASVVQSTNQSVTSCIPVLDGGISCPGISRVSNSNMGCFSLAPFKCPTRRCCPG